MDPLSIDLPALVPQWSLRDAAEFATRTLFDVVLPGLILTQLLRFRSGCRAERYAMVGMLGVLFCCFRFWIESAATDDPHARLQLSAYVMLGTALAFVAMFGVKVKAFLAKRNRPGKRSIRIRRPTRWEAAGYGVIVVLAAYYLVRTVPLFDFDGERLRLYGAAFSDKTTNMMSCQSLQHGVPPDCLRFAGSKFPSHYFPHLFAAGISFDYDAAGLPRSPIAAFWFYVPALGILLNGLAILAFARRVLKSYSAGCLALAIYGLTSVTPQLKPLDITPAAALLALLALDRFHHSGRKRWAGLAVVLIGTMPCFEAFHALLMLAALGLWGGVGFVAGLWNRRRDAGPSQSVAWNLLVVPALAGLAAFGSLQLLYVGERPVAPPKITVDNVFGDSFRNTWEARTQDDDRSGQALAKLDRWKRKPKPGDDTDAPVAWYERGTAKLLYTVGIPVYVFCRFVHLASFGAVYLRRKRRTAGLRPSEQIIGAAAMIGFTVPWFVDVGIHAGGSWWSSPNLYRPTEFGSWLLATLGVGLIVELATHRTTWKRPMTWFLGAVAAYWLVTISAEHLAPTTAYLEVPRDQLRSLAFMRREIPYRDVVMHPWSNCEIRDAANGDAVSFVYKRHFTLGSNLAGRTMFYEGREDYTFSNGFIAPDEVFRRSKARAKFYDKPDAGAIAEILDWQAGDARRVKFIVEDVGFAAPQVVRETWPIVFQSGDVVIRSRP